MSTSERIFAALCELGVVASISDGDPQAIEIADGPIRRVDIDDPDSNRYPDYEYTIRCFVPDPRIGPDFLEFEAGSVRVKSFPVFGWVTGVRWDLRNEFFLYQGFAGLGRNRVLTEGIIAGSDITIFSDGQEGGWLLSAGSAEVGLVYGGQMRKWTTAASLRPIWDGYPAIAEHLLAMPIP